MWSFPIPFPIFAVAFLVGYLPNFLVRGRRGFLPVVAGELVLGGTLVVVTFSVSFLVGVAAAVVVGPLVIGMGIGAIVRAGLLALRWPVTSIRGLVALVVGLLLFPVGFEMRAAVRTLWVADHFARLPNASTLPQVAACAPFRNAGPLIDVSLRGQSATGSIETIALRFPVAYDERFGWMDRIPSGNEAGAEFRARLGDGGAFTRLDARGPNNTWIPENRQPPFVDFLIARGLRYDFPRRGHAPLRERIAEAAAHGSARKETDPIDLVQTPAPPSHIGSTTDTHYLAMSGDQPSGFLTCSPEHGPAHARCHFAIDHRGIVISGRFRHVELGRWTVVRRLVEDFTDCAVAAAAAAQGSGTGAAAEPPALNPRP